MNFALSRTKEGTFSALLGLLPLFIFYFCAYLVFSTEWGKANPALGLLLLAPIYCEMATKNIICSVTKVINL